VSFLPIFSHIYVEDKARELPLTHDLLARFSKATVIPISNYKEVFNRPRQVWRHQEESKKLILAVRGDSFLYPGSPFVPSFDHARFFYTSPILNCIYGCEYCYLQGMFSSAHLVAFVNREDFIEQAQRELTGGPAYLCVSYDTDLLALEDLFGYCARWNDFAHANPHVTVEIRTKSAAIKALIPHTPAPNVILAWTLSPESVAKRFEHGTPSTEARIKAIKIAQDHGWNVRICLDPILRTSGWQQHYPELIKQMAQTLNLAALVDISVGVFRINGSYLREMQQRAPHSRLVTYPYTVENGAASYAPHERAEMLSLITDHLKNYVPEEKICPVPWQF
jgi:spore photoproduct lyase